MTLDSVFERFDSLRIVVVGDVMLDSYVWGKVDRISPEAPVPVVQVTRREYRLGGAGNVLLNLQALGAIPLVCTVIGADGFGDLLEKELRDRQIDCQGVIRSEKRLTTIKERILAGSQQVVRVDTELDTPINTDERTALIRRATALIPTADAVLFEDYDKGVLDPESIAAITACANAHGIPTVVDPKKRNFMAYQHTTLFKPNLKELKEGLKLDFDADDRGQLEQAAQVLKDKLLIKGSLITLSERGVFIDLDGQIHHLPAHYRQIADVSGAGDTVISIAACCTALGLPVRTIAALSNLGGGLVCEQVGVVPVDKSLLLSEAKRLAILAEE